MKKARARAAATLEEYREARHKKAMYRLGTPEWDVAAIRVAETHGNYTDAAREEAWAVFRAARRRNNG